jgi:pilus assembly protein CpaE
MEEKIKILIADDAQTTRRGTRLMLALNPKVEVAAIAHDGKQAVELFQEKDIDVALIDVNMPRLDGISAVEEILKIKPTTYCIIISAERGSGTLQRAMTAGAREYLIKPYTTEELEEAIERAYIHISTHRDEKEIITESANIQKEQADEYALKLAEEYAKSRRRDNEAVAVFERLADDPNCDIKWLMHLSMIYTLRKDWGKLKVLAARLESLDG